MNEPTPNNVLDSEFRRQGGSSGENMLLRLAQVWEPSRPGGAAGLLESDWKPFGPTQGLKGWMEESPGQRPGSVSYHALEA